MRTLEQALTERMNDPAFRTEYEALEPEFSIIQAIVDARPEAVRPHAKGTVRKDGNCPGRY